MIAVEEHVIQVCRPRFLPKEKLAEADAKAIEENPENRTAGAHLGGGDGSGEEKLVVDRKVYWGKRGVRLTVGFLDNPEPALRRKILEHMNAWNAKGANIHFVESSTDPQVRIARLDSPRKVAGFWSYLGTDILTIPKDEPTMNLEGFTMHTKESEFFRVVRHEAGHTLGFPHEHMRRELVTKLDRERVFAAYWESYKWSRAEVEQQVLTPLEDSSIFGSPPDARSIMCYQIEGELTLDRKPIIGGTDIDATDYEIAGLLYPGPGH